MCISTGNSDSIFFLGGMPLFELRTLKILPKEFVSATESRSTEFCETVYLWWTLCIYIYIFPQNADLIFSRSNLYPFWTLPNLFCATQMKLVFCLIGNWHSLYTAFSSNVGAWGMWACSLFLSFSMFFWLYG